MRRLVQVQHWSESVPKSLARIKLDMKDIVKQFSDDRRALDFKVRKYSETPVVHGWAIRRPIKLWHVAHCRWKGVLYDWGGERYVRVDQTASDSVTNEVAKLFDSYFDHLWEVSPPADELQFEVFTLGKTS